VVWTPSRRYWVIREGCIARYSAQRTMRSLGTACWIWELIQALLRWSAARLSRRPRGTTQRHQGPRHQHSRHPPPQLVARTNRHNAPTGVKTCDAGNSQTPMPDTARSTCQSCNPDLASRREDCNSSILRIRALLASDMPAAMGAVFGVLVDLNSCSPCGRVDDAPSPPRPQCHSLRSGLLQPISKVFDHAHRAHAIQFRQLATGQTRLKALDHQLHGRTIETSNQRLGGVQKQHPERGVRQEKLTDTYRLLARQAWNVDGPILFRQPSTLLIIWQTVEVGSRTSRVSDSHRIH